MDRSKIIGHSAVLGREFHADAFRLGPAALKPRLHVLMFGGSGVDPAEYTRRRDTVVPVFDAALAQLEGEGLAFAFTYVTAPALAEHPDIAQRWTLHLETELLPKLPPLPLYLVGYSEGAALALAGPQRLPSCVGVGTLGGDTIPANLAGGAGWREPAALYYNLGDPVFGQNAHLLVELEESCVAKVFRRQPGGHDLADYLANESFGGLVRRAYRLVA